MTPDTWTDCYRDGWEGLITPAAFANPAVDIPLQDV